MTNQTITPIGSAAVTTKDGKGLRKSLPSVDDLKANAVRVLHELSELETKRTDAFRDLAAFIVGIRAQTDHNGHPDWAGRSAAYREHIAQIYAEAEIPTDRASGFQSSLRYHISTILRRVAPADELKALGLNPESVNERRQLPARTAGDGTQPETDRKPASEVAGPGEVTSENPVHLIESAVLAVQRANTLPMPDRDSEDFITLGLAVQLLLGTIQEYGAKLTATDTTARDETPQRERAKAAA